MAGKAFGVQSPTQGETAVSWQTWTDGSGNVPTISGDANWGKLKLDLSGEEGRSAVYDLGSETTRKFTLTENRYGTGEEDATLQYRTDTSSFAQDDVLPAWTTYSAPFSVNCRYVQVREITLSIVTYYVDATGGDDDNTGLSIDQAWQTLTKVSSITFDPGDHILFKRGETFVGSLIPQGAGTDSQYIVFGVYGTGSRPIIDGSSSRAFLIADSDYHHLRIEHIDFSGCEVVANRSTVECWTHDVYWYDCIFRDSAGTSNSFGYNSYALTAGGAEIYNLTLDSCEIYNNNNSGLNIGSSAGTYGPHDCLVTNCISHDNGTNYWADHGFYCKHGVTFDKCTAYNNSFGGGFKTNCQSVFTSPYHPRVTNCVSYNNYMGIVADNIGSVIYNNLFYGNTNRTVSMSSDGRSSLIYFNTFVNTTASGDGLIFIDSGLPTNVIYKDNLFIQDRAVSNIPVVVGSGVTLANLISNNTFDYNTYYHGDATTLFYDGTTRTWTDWTGYGAEAHGTLLAAVPDFVARYTDLHPSDGGNLKALGAAIAGYGYDKDSNARADPPTPGCYEEASA